MTDHLLTHTGALMNHVYWFTHNLGTQPQRDHRGVAINYTDISERTADFLNELINTVSSWVYSKSKAKQIIDERLAVVNGDAANAASFLTLQAFSKFRPSYPQGQFGELLLFSFIQHFFGAVPLLRKQRITTSVGHERFGADAIHYRYQDPQHQFFLGESKCYKSDYSFSTAFETSLDSIVNTFSSFSQELGLYVHDDFIEPELEHVAKQYKAGTLAPVLTELVCLVAYCESRTLRGTSEAEVKAEIQSVIIDRCKKIDPAKFASIRPAVLQRINYIVFPIWNLDSLLGKFQRMVGVT